MTNYRKMKHLMNSTAPFCTLPMPKSIICIWFRSFPMKWLYTFWNGMVLESTSYIWVGKFDNYSPISSNMMYHFSSYLLKLQGIFLLYILLNNIISFFSINSEDTYISEFENNVNKVIRNTLSLVKYLRFYDKNKKLDYYFQLEIDLRSATICLHLARLFPAWFNSYLLEYFMFVLSIFLYMVM